MDESFNVILQAVIDRIIPADDFPSASGAGVMNYLSRQLAGDVKSFAAPLAEGLARIERSAVDRHGKNFTAIAVDLQDAILKEFETQSFFVGLIELTCEGFYADPGNGGNIDEISWRMIGYQPRVRGNMT